jgi:RNA polymerase sigma factor (sigma-70 family)
MGEPRHPRESDDDRTDVTDLVAAAALGDADAWAEIVHRYTRLLVRVLLPYRLTSGELEDVAQIVWLRLIEHLGDLREPRALPRWMITTARREAVYAAMRSARQRPADPHDPMWSRKLVADDEADGGLLRAERHEALLEALATLSPRQRELLVLLAEDPPVPYAEISRRTGIAMGAIGPTRARALERLRAAPSMRALGASAAEHGRRPR